MQPLSETQRKSKNLIQFLQAVVLILLRWCISRRRGCSISNNPFLL